MWRAAKFAFFASRPRLELPYTASVCDTPQARHSKVANSGRPSNRDVRRASRIGCAQLGQRGGASIELDVLVSHMVVIPGLKDALL
jgi:hypothetical protein